MWTCSTCTFRNKNARAKCKMCSTAKAEEQIGEQGRDTFTSVYQDSSYNPSSWEITTGPISENPLFEQDELVEYFDSHYRDREKPFTLWCVYREYRPQFSADITRDLVGILAEPTDKALAKLDKDHSHKSLRGLVVTCPGAGGGPGPARSGDKNAASGGTYGGYDVYFKLAHTLPLAGIAVLLLHYPSGLPEGAAEGKIAERVVNTRLHMMALTKWFHSRYQQSSTGQREVKEGKDRTRDQNTGDDVALPTVFIGWSMGGAVAMETTAAFLADSSSLSRMVAGCATIATQRGRIRRSSIQTITNAKLPLCLMVGTDDRCLDYQKHTIRLSAQCKVDPVIFDGEDHGVPSAYNKLTSWIPETLAEKQAALLSAGRSHSQSSRSRSRVGRDSKESKKSRESKESKGIFKLTRKLRYDTDLLTSRQLKTVKAAEHAVDVRLKGPILFTAPHTIKLCQPRKHFYVEKRTDSIAKKLAAFCGNKGSYVCWRNRIAGDKVPTNLDPNYLDQKNQIISPWHWAVRNHHDRHFEKGIMPFHVDIHGKKNRPGRNPIPCDLGLVPMEVVWPDETEACTLKELVYTEVTKAFEGTEFSANPDPRLHGYWGTKVRTISEQSVRLGTPALQLELFPALRQALDDDDPTLRNKFGQALVNAFNQWIAMFYPDMGIPA